MRSCKIVLLFAIAGATATGLAQERPAPPPPTLPPPSLNVEPPTPRLTSPSLSLSPTTSPTLPSATLPSPGPPARPRCRDASDRDCDAASANGTAGPQR